jgi:Dolichyl-phosphate-mannose-protein mannosyltransferase
MRSISKPVLLKLYFLTGAVESAVVFCLLLAIPADLKNIVFLGYSLRRLLLLGVVLVLFFFFGLFSVRISMSEKLLGKTVIFVEDVFNSSWQYFLLYFLSLSLLVFGIVLALMPLERLAGIGAYLQRLAPVVYLAAVLGAQTLVGQFLWRDPKLNWSVFFEQKKLFVITGFLVGALLGLSAWVAWTGLGLTPEVQGWLPPGTPIIFSQLFLAWLIGLPFIIWRGVIEKAPAGFQETPPGRIRLDMIICIVLWCAAFLLWWGEPMRKEGYFTSSPAAPNFEHYPFSDALIYDQAAQNILIGAEQNNKTILRPLYVFSLMFLHVIGGQKYENVILIQILFLAIVPVLAYLLTSMLGGRAAGVLTAILIIFREKNAIALTNVIEVSHSKLLMSDVPMMALMLLMMYFLVRWLRGFLDNDYLGIITGASFGMLMLVRSHQAQLIIPVLLLGMLFSGGFQLKRSFRRVLVFVFGFAIIVAPWVWRNYEVNGKPEIESTEFYISWYAGAYTEPADTVNILPSESPDDYSARIKRQIFQYIIHHPVELATVYTSYFIRNEIDSVIYLPMSLKLDDMRSYISRMQFWSEPLLGFTIGSGLIFSISLGLIVFGIAIAAQRLGFLGLMPLFIHFAYNFSMTLARISGWRFVLPVDWVMELYYCAGLAALTVLTISLISNKLSMGIYNKNDDEEIANPAVASFKLQRLLLIFFLLLGLSLPATEMLIPDRYPDSDANKLLAQHMVGGFLLENGNRITAADVKTFIETETAAVVLNGRALYPLFYKQGDFVGDDNPFSLLVRNLDRLQFTYIGSENALVFIQLDRSPRYFPNASDVFIIGCRQAGGIKALAVKVNDQTSFLTTSPWQGLACPAR